jgi:hypothetical protein
MQNDPRTTPRQSDEPSQEWRLWALAGAALVWLGTRMMRGEVPQPLRWVSEELREEIRDNW